MKRFLLCLTVFLGCLASGAQDISFEETHFLADRTYFEELYNWEDGLLRERRCNGPWSDFTTLQKTDYSGQVEWEIENQLYLDDYTFGTDGSIWTLEVEYGCDYIGSIYQVSHFSSQGALLSSFSSESEPDGWVDFSWLGNQICQLNDSLLMFGTSQGIATFNLIDESFTSILPSLVDAFSPVPEMIPLGNSQAVTYIQDLVFVINHEGVIIESFGTDDVVKDILSAEGNVLVVTAHGAKIHAPDGTILYGMELDPNQEIQKVVYQDGMLLTYTENESTWFQIRDTQLNLTNEWEVTETDILDIKSFVRAGDSYIFTGRNGHHSSSHGITKIYSLSGETATYDMDIELLDVQLGWVEAHFQAETEDFTVFWATAHDFTLQVRNNGATPINYFTAHTVSPLIDTWCGAATSTAINQESIQPGEVGSVVIDNVPLGYLYNLTDLQTYSFNRCFWTQAPGQKMDDVPENDYLCMDFEWVYTSIEEQLQQDFEVFYDENSQALRLSEHPRLDWTIFDLSGRVISQGVSAENTSEILLSPLPMGMYIFTCRGGQMGVSKKFVVRR